MSRTAQRWREVFTTLQRRARTLGRAFRRRNDEDRSRLIRFVAVHLPISTEGKLRVNTWALKRFGPRKFSASTLASAQRTLAEKGRARLDCLLAADEKLALNNSASPRVSFILVLFNRAELSVLAIESILMFGGKDYELICVDNASVDTTPALLERLEGAIILRNQTNVGFGPACMQAAAISRGEFLCFLNNDAVLTEGAIDSALANLERAGVGAVGGKVVLADGSLQEAGSIVWSDGSACGYGRGEDPTLPQYNFRRPVDYCSSVFLVTRKELFDAVVGDSTEFAPAYYEDTDYCMELWKRGFGVVYEPMSRIQHYESASSGGLEQAAVLMLTQQAKFRHKWKAELQKHRSNDPRHVIPARIATSATGLRVIYIDDRLPQRHLGAGFPRSNDVLRELVRLGHHLVCASFRFPLVEDKCGDIPLDVEQFDACRFREELIRDYFPWADVVWISRPHNMKLLLTEYPNVVENRNFALVYDAEAIFSERMQAQEALLGDVGRVRDFLDPANAEEEYMLARAADAVVVVSERDRQTMLSNGVRRAFVVANRVSNTPSEPGFSERHNYLFIGSVHGTENPNADSIRYFCSNIWKQVQRATGGCLEIAGYGTDTMRSSIADDTVHILGQVDDLRPLYERARVFIVPTRYAAGIPIKSHEAAAHGVPQVVSELIAKQLQWEEGNDYLVASDATQFAQCCLRLYCDEDLWYHIRNHARMRVECELNETVFRNAVGSVLSDIRPDSAARTLRRR